MNYKNNLFTKKKKYKIVNQKAGGIEEWKFIIEHYNEDVSFVPFDITILKDSGWTGGYLGLGYDYGLKRVVNGKEVSVDFKIKEQEFIKFLYECTKEGKITENCKKNLEPLGLTPDMIRAIVASIAFPPCFPKSFSALHTTAKKFFIDKYNIKEKRCKEDTFIKKPISRCGPILGWMLNYKENVKSTQIIDNCK